MVLYTIVMIMNKRRFGSDEQVYAEGKRCKQGRIVSRRDINKTNKGARLQSPVYNNVTGSKSSTQQEQMTSSRDKGVKQEKRSPDTTNWHLLHGHTLFFPHQAPAQTYVAL